MFNPINIINITRIFYKLDSFGVEAAKKIIRMDHFINDVPIDLLNV